MGRLSTALAISTGALAAIYVAACVLPAEPSGAERIQFTLDFPGPYRVPLAGVGEPPIMISADGQVLANPSYRLESLDSSVVRVDSTERRLFGVTRGTASVRAAYPTAIGTADTVFSVRVVVSRIVVAPAATSITRLGASTPLSATAYDAKDAAVLNVAFTWSSADPQVATVNDTGLVRAIDEGTVAITAEVDSITGSAQVSVTQVAAAVRVSPELDTLRAVGRAVQFIALAFDSNSTLLRTARPHWTSSEPLVASVDAAGRATATGAGTAHIIARVGDAADTATLVVAQVIWFLEVTPGFDTLTAIADTVRFAAMGFDSSGIRTPNPTVAWTTSDTTIATVDQTGFVRARANGVVHVTAASTGHSAFATIMVRQEVARAQISPDNVPLIGQGATAQLNAVGLDRNGYLVGGASFAWRSGSECVATVEAGLITAHGNGATAITATPTTGGQSGTATVSVTGAGATGITIAFESSRGIEAMCEDGFGRTVLIENGSDYIVSDPSWSPDGARLAFTRTADGWATCAIYTARVDGSEVRRVTSGPECDLHPAWSPDGTKLAFGSGDALCTSHCAMDLNVVNVDGSDRRMLLPSGLGAWYTNPTWSPDGSKLGFENYVYECYDVYCFHYEISVVNADGTGGGDLTSFPLANGQDDNTEPAWSPDGSQIAFVRNGDVWLMNADGSGSRNLTTSPYQSEGQPAWSPDGAQIVFVNPGSCWGWPYPPCIIDASDLYVINSDGTGLQRLTSTDDNELKPAWRPFPSLLTSRALPGARLRPKR